MLKISLLKLLLIEAIAVQKSVRTVATFMFPLKGMRSTMETRSKNCSTLLQIRLMQWPMLVDIEITASVSLGLDSSFLMMS